MSCGTTVLFLTLVGYCFCSEIRKFPPWFKFGCSTSAYQVEGAWNVNDKTESKWDRLTHTVPEIIKDHSNGDIACNSYYNWQRDLQMASELGLDFYRFSISWPRILPNGVSNYISEDGVNYYNNLIDGLLEKGIEPLVTIYHWEMPQILQDFGGWANPLISDWFADYARVVFTLFGDRVKIWLTINEPFIECEWYHGSGPLGPGAIGASSVEPYLCNKYILMAHAKAWRIYDQEFRNKYHGKVSIANHLLWLKPHSHKDKELTYAAREFLNGRYSHPIYSKEGGWPPIVQEILDKISFWQGYTRPILPPFTPEEIELVRGTYDFFGMNHYTTRVVRKKRPGEYLVPFVYTYLPEINAVLEGGPDWEYGYNKLMGVVPEGMRDLLVWLKKRYGDIEIFITENGYSTYGNELNDTDRISYINKYLEQVLLSIDDGVNVTGYTYWSLMDNFEWIDGYLSKFGLYEVDFGDPLRTRTPRSSAIYYANVIKHHSLDISP